MAYTIAGSFVTASGGTNGASVDGWRASRFDGAIPAEGQTPPSGTADTAVSITGTGFGGPGSFQLYTNTNEPYYVRIQYSGTTYWQLQPNVINTNDVAGGQTASSIVDSGGQVFNVCHPDFGADPTGLTDSTAAIEAAINACATGTDSGNIAGGTVYFPPGQYRVTQTINLPVTNVPSNTTNNTPQTPIYISAPLRITGAGGNSAPRGDGPDFGSTIYFDPTAAATLFNGVGEGTFEFDHMGIVDISAQENLFFFVNNTVTNIHDCAFDGNNSFTNAWTDVIQYGAQGGTAPRGDVLGIYQGQVSRLVNNACTRIRHLARLYADASNILISANAMYNTCGTNTANDAAIIVVGPGAGGNYFEYNDFEMGTFVYSGDTPVRSPNGYAYAISFNSGNNNTLIGNQIADCYTGTGTAYPSAQAAYYFSAVTYNSAGLPIGGSYDNVVMEGGRDVNAADNVYIPWAAGAGGANMNLRACPQFISGGAGGVIYGPVVRAGDGQFFMQAATQIVTTNSAGWGAIGFPAAFPNGVVAVNAISNGDNNTSDAALNWVGQVFDVTPGGFFFYLQNGTGAQSGLPTNNVQIAISWIAIGF